MTKVGTSPYLQSISGAMMGTLGAILVGSIAVVLLVLPSSVSALSFLAKYNGIFSKLHTLTIGFMSLYVVALISYLLVKKLNENGNGISASVIALLSFLVVTPLGATADEVSAIPTTWLGAQGVFSAIIVGLTVAKLFTVIKERKLVIKMPAGVPPMVTDVFESLIPCIVIVLMFTIINALFELTSYGSMHQFVYSVIQKPLQGLGGSIAAVIIIILVQQTLWMAMDVENLNALAAGLPLPHITGYAFYNIACLGALTNAAGAVLYKPEIADKITVVWVGGRKNLSDNEGFEANTRNDYRAVNVVMEKYANIIQIPEEIYSKVQVSIAELQCKVRDCGAIGAYLFDQLNDFNYRVNRFWTQGESWTLGDTTAIAFLINRKCGILKKRKAFRVDEALKIEHMEEKEIEYMDDFDSRYALEDFFAKLYLKYGKKG